MDRTAIILYFICLKLRTGGGSKKGVNWDQVSINLLIESLDH